MHLPPKAQDISAGQRSDRRVHPLLQPRAPPDKDWPGSALASPGQSLIRLFYPLQASFLYCPHNMGRFRPAGRCVMELLTNSEISLYHLNHGTIKKNGCEAYDETRRQQTTENDLFDAGGTDAGKSFPSQFGAVCGFQLHLRYR